MIDTTDPYPEFLTMGFLSELKAVAPELSKLVADVRLLVSEIAVVVADVKAITAHLAPAPPAA